MACKASSFIFHQIRWYDKKSFNIHNVQFSMFCEGFHSFKITIRHGDSSLLDLRSKESYGERMRFSQNPCESRFRLFVL